MAAGQRLAGPIGTQAGPNRYPAQDARGLLYIGALRGGLLANSRPIAIRSLAFPAQRIRSFFDDWYNRIHVAPMAINFGFVASQMSQGVYVWNAYFSNSTLDSISFLNNAGVSLAGPATPKVLLPLQNLRYDVVVAEDGLFQIDTTVVFKFSDRSDEPHLKVTGQRAKLFDFRPNWRESVHVNLAYRTDIFTSRSGREQRRALRGDARKTIEFTIGVHRDKLRSFQRLMHTWQSRPVTMGDPTRQTLTTTELVATGLQMNVAEVPRWLTAGSPVLLESGDTRKIVIVSSISGTQITLSTGVDEAWPVGTSVRPTVSGLLDSEISSSLPINELMEVSLSLAVDPGSEPVFTTEPGAMHNGREVFPFAVNWRDPLDATFAWPRDTVDFGFGLTQTYSPVDFDTTTWKASFLNVSVAQAQAMEDFFRRAKGQRGEFYWPSGINDLPPAAQLIAGTDFLRVAGTEVFDDYKNDTVHRAVAISLSNGQTLLRTVIDIRIETLDTIIQFSELWASTIPASDIVMVSWLTAARFASDQFSAEWMTSTVMQTQLAVQTLEDLPAETAA